MDKKKIAFVGFWDTFNIEKNLLYKILCKHYNVEICDKSEADYSICSLYNNDFLDTEGIRIFYTAEAMVPDFTLFDYCIGFDEMYFGDRYIRVPNYLMNLKYQEDIKYMRERHIIIKPSKLDFCSWVCSNGNGDHTRDYLFESLSQYKKVDSAGCYRNNIGRNERIPNKREFQKNYKFSLALENTSYKGYTTEKLVEAFAAGGIPIYWGDPDVGKVFNKKAFINLMDFSSIEEGIEYVKKIDQNDGLYRNMVSQKALNSDAHIEEVINDLETFVLNIFNQPINEAVRRPSGQTAYRIEQIIRNGLSPIKNDKRGYYKIIDCFKGLGRLS